MNTLLISYDLRAPGKNYTNLIEFIKSHNNWAKPLESVWMVKSSSTAEIFRNSLLAHVDQNDQILVIDVTKDAAAWNSLSPEVSQWIKSYI